VHVNDGWNPETAGGQSILVHQIVYHLQNLASLKYECPQARARVAYEAQMRWLGRTGRTLEREFGIDPEVLSAGRLGVQIDFRFYSARGRKL
jgi:hypothetical protein